MGRKRKPVPTYRLHRPSGRAFVKVGSEYVYLGTYGSKESKAEYTRVCAEIQVREATARPSPAAADLKSGRTVAEVAEAFAAHAQTHYRREDGTATNEVREYMYLFRPVVEMYGHTPAADFGPLAVKAVRKKFVELGWARTTVNNRVRRLKHVFTWAAGEELIPSAVPEALMKVKGLRKGRTTAREPEKIEPAVPADVDATVAKLGPVPAAMVRVLRLTGCRPQDVVNLRPADLDTSGPVWIFRPGQHKTAWREQERVVAIGPHAQAVLKEWWPADPASYFFDPRQAVALRNERRRKVRATPLYASHAAHIEAKRKPEPKRPPAAQYTVHSLENAIRRAAKAAGVEHWAPGQLRHSWGTAVRAKYGAEAARVGLGHEHLSTTEIYAEKDLALAVKVAAEMG